MESETVCLKQDQEAVSRQQGKRNKKHEKYYFVFWLNHNDEARSTNVSHKELFDWFKIDQAEFDKKFVKSSELEEQLVK